MMHKEINPSWQKYIYSGLNEEMAPSRWKGFFLRLQGHTALKIVDFDPNWAFPTIGRSRLQIPQICLVSVQLKKFSENRCTWGNWKGFLPQNFFSCRNTFFLDFRKYLIVRMISFFFSLHGWMAEFTILTKAVPIWLAVLWWSIHTRRWNNYGMEPYQCYTISWRSIHANTCKYILHLSFT